VGKVHFVQDWLTFENEICEIGKNNIQETTTAQLQIFESCFYVKKKTMHKSPIESAKNQQRKFQKLLILTISYF
jgi:hypothetical protein